MKFATIHREDCWYGLVLTDRDLSRFAGTYDRILGSLGVPGFIQEILQETDLVESISIDRNEGHAIHVGLYESHHQPETLFAQAAEKICDGVSYFFDPDGTKEIVEIRALQAINAKSWS